MYICTLHPIQMDQLINGNYSFSTAIDLQQNWLIETRYRTTFESSRFYFCSAQTIRTIHISIARISSEKSEFLIWLISSWDWYLLFYNFSLRLQVFYWALCKFGFVLPFPPVCVLVKKKLLVFQSRWNYNEYKMVFFHNFLMELLNI